MKRALLLLAVVACERDHGVHFHMTPPTVGTRTTFHLRLDGSFKTPDGVDHGMHHELGLIFVAEAVGSNGRADRLRVTVDRDDNVIDGQSKPTLSGTYEATNDGHATRADGKPLAPNEVEFFRDLHDPSNDPEGTSHVFHAGETFRPTDREVEAFGLPKSKTPLALTVRRATDAEIVLAGDYTPTESMPGVEAHGRIVVTLTPQSHTRVGDITMTQQGKEVGAIHATTELRRVPQR